MVNLGLLKFLVRPKYIEAFEDYATGSSPPSPLPNLFTDFKLFKLAERNAFLASFPEAITIFTAFSGVDRILCDGLSEFLDASVVASRQRRAIIAPSKGWCTIIGERLIKLGLKPAFFNSALSPARTRKLLGDVLNGKRDIAVGTRALAPLTSHFGPSDVFLFDADSTAFDAEPTHPDVLGILGAGLADGSTVFIHHFKGAGAKEAGISPDISPAFKGKTSRTPTKKSPDSARKLHRGLPDSRLEVVNLARWKESPKGDNPVALLAIEVARGGSQLLLVQNRLGESSGFYCAECYTDIPCPRCGAMLHFTGGRYKCSTCGFSDSKIACPACGSTSLGRTAPGIFSTAKDISKLLGSKDGIRTFFSESDIGRSDSSNESGIGTNADKRVNDKAAPGISISTDVCLYRRLPVHPDAIVVTGIEDKLSRYAYSGGERSSAYLARIRGIYSGESTRLIVGTFRYDHPFFRWLRGENDGYFVERKKLALKRGLPPFAPMFVVRVRASAYKQAWLFAKALKSEFGESSFLDPVALRGASVTRKVLEIEAASPLDNFQRKTIVALGRKYKIEALPYVTYF
ncbi:hypothetical protein J7K50_09285 [bacterium]|nr:hypothetical protein [bacterium]